MLKFREMCVTLHGILEKRHIFDETDQDNIPADSHMTARQHSMTMPPLLLLDWAP